MEGMADKPEYSDVFALDWLIDTLKSEWERGNEPASDVPAPTERPQEVAQKGA